LASCSYSLAGEGLLQLLKLLRVEGQWVHGNEARLRAGSQP
jgi:hypothetical protein